MAVSRIDEAGLNVNQYGNRNLIINGAMQVAQRATSATTVSGSGVYDTIDRLKLWEDSDGAYTSEQSSTAPDGFATSVKFQVTTADTSLSSAQYACVAQIIEAQNLQQLAYGTNAAKDITVSFYVRSNKTGTYCLCVEKNDSTRYLFVKEFTIDTADTWERKIITVPPDSNIKASGGAIANNNGDGFRVFIFLASGSSYHGTNNVWNTNTSYFTTSNQVNWLDSTSNNFYLTGMQLEVGDTATDFEHRTFGDELARCQRYFCRTYTYGTATGTATANGCVSGPVFAAITYSSPGTFRFPVEMRSAPTVQVYSTQNADTTGKVTADAADGTAGTAFTGTASTFIYRNNDSTGVVANAFLKAQATADAEL